MQLTSLPKLPGGKEGLILYVVAKWGSQPVTLQTSPVQYRTVLYSNPEAWFDRQHIAVSRNRTNPINGIDIRKGRGTP